MEQQFIVVVTDRGDDDDVIKRIEKQPDRYQINDDIWLVRSGLLVKDLAEELGVGIEGESGSGLVFRLNGSYWGKSSQNTWDWMSRGR